MTSAASPTQQEIKAALDEKGFCCLPERVFGSRFAEFESKEFPFKTIEGLDFCKTNTLDDPRVTQLLESTFSWCSLGLYQIYRSDPDHIGCFLAPKDTACEALVVQIWSPGSQAVFCRELHRKPSQTSQGNLFLEIPHAEVPPACMETVNMEEGGLVVLDSRLPFIIRRGQVISFVFADQKRLIKFRKMRLPNQAALKAKVGEMIRPNIGLNFEFEG